MDRNVTAFRKRFDAYKNGKSISEIYDAGLPRYAEGTKLPIEQMMPYILAVENPTKQGLVNGVWRPPTDSSKWDTHAIGGGLDIREENNPIVYNYLKSKGRLNNPYLTVAEEEMLRKQTFEKTTLPALRKMYGKYKDKISEKGYARLAGMKWQGHPYLMAITPDSITGKAFLNAVASGDRDLDSVFDAYYKYPANAKRYGARINADTNYWKNYSTSSNVEPKSELVQLLEQLDKEKFLPWSNYHSPDYSLSNPTPSTISSWNNPTSPAFNTSGLYARRATNNINNVVQDILFNDKDVQDALMDNLSKNVFGGKRLGFKNGKLPGFRRGKIGHNVSRAQVNDDGTFTDDYTKVFEDMYVTPLKTDLKRNSHTWNSWNYYKSNPTAWMLPFMSSGTNEKGLELTHPEFDLLLGGRQIATLLFPLKSSIKDATEEMINFEDIAKKAAKMKANDDAWRAAHPEYEIENIIKKLKLPNAYDPAIEDLVKNANLEDKSLRSVFDKMLYENKDFHGKQIVNLHNNRAKLNGDFVDDAGQVFDVDTPEGYENAILFLEKHFFGTRDGAERLLKDPDFQSRLAGLSMPRGNKPVFISRNKLILRQERDLGRKLTLQEADDLYYKVISHERHHSFDKIHNTPEGFNLDGLNPDDYFVKNGFDELAARGTLLKNMFGLYKNPLTAAHLRYASSQYFKDPSNINNNMTRFFNMITDYDKAAKWLLENATAVLPYTVGGSIVASLPEYKNGKSPIHIKPANRGKLTRLKARTGKSESELYNDGNPAHKKMVVFARNARKWSHK